VTNNLTGTTTRTTRTSEGGAAVTRNGPGVGNNSGVARTGSGDVYAGRDGNVYRKEDGGGWQKYDGGGNWNNVPEATPQQREQAQQRANDARAQAGSRSSTDAATVNQLNRDSAARAEGAQRTRDAGSSGVRSGGGASTYRPSGGGRSFRGGGGRRR
jgi:hypothetical protein